MSHRWIVAVVAAFTVVLAGCGSDKAPAPKSSTATSTTAANSDESSAAESSPAESSPDESSAEASSEPDESLASKCTDLTGANLELAMASTKDDAQKQAVIFAKYDPPADVQEAIDHFVSTEGPQLTDPKYDEYDKRITNWVESECPRP